MRGVARPLLPALSTALTAQNSAYEPSPARDAHLAALASGAAAVVTGQQTGLFLGPLYTLYKAASTIRLAQHLEATWNAPVVPVFWLQTEDHDAAEIAECHIARGSEEPLSLKLDVAAEPIPVRHRVLPKTVKDALAALSEAIGRLPHGEEHLALLARHYREGRGWAEAFAGVLAALFAEEGLVLIDPRDPALAALAAPIHRGALTDARSIAAGLASRAQALTASGFQPGVHVREEAPLSFFHPEGAEGPRYRLAPADGGYVEVGRKRFHSQDELLRILETEPARFSTSALLRPILQDSWLPTAAYVGGPGEVAYFAQLAPVYEAFSLTMPIVVPRAQFRLVERAARDAMTRRGLTAFAACAPFEQVLATHWADETSSGAAIARGLILGIDRELDSIAPDIDPWGERGRTALEKTRRSMARFANKLGRSLDRARQLADRDRVEDLRRIQARLIPHGVPQERYFGLPSFAARYGQHAIVRRVLDSAHPLQTGFEDLDL